MLSAVNEYQGLRPENITGVRDPYLNIIGSYSATGDLHF